MSYKKCLETQCSDQCRKHLKIVLSNPPGCVRAYVHWHLHNKHKRSLYKTAPYLTHQSSVLTIDWQVPRTAVFGKHVAVCASVLVWPLPGGLLPSQPQNVEYGFSGCILTNKHTNNAESSSFGSAPSIPSTLYLPTSMMHSGTHELITKIVCVHSVLLQVPGSLVMSSTSYVSAPQQK